MNATVAPAISQSDFIATRNPSARETTGTAEQQRDVSWRSRPALVGTDVLSRADDHGVVVSRNVSAVDEGPAEHGEKRNYVDGVISTKIENDLVECIVKVGERDLTITLPQDCFEMPIKFGRPFRLSMEQRNGYRVPRATPIEPTPLTDEDAAFIESILGSSR